MKKVKYQDLFENIDNEIDALDVSLEDIDDPEMTDEPTHDRKKEKED
jgi:hypothetical protein